MVVPPRPTSVGPHRVIESPEEFFGPDVHVFTEPLRWAKEHMKNPVWHVRQSYEVPRRGRVMSNAVSTEGSGEGRRVLENMEVAINHRTGEFLQVAGYVDEPMHSLD